MDTKFKDLNEGDCFIIPIVSHIGLSKEEITELCKGNIFNNYMIKYTKQSDLKKPEFNAIRKYITSVDCSVHVTIPDDEDVIKL